jgi:hypothetical protein
VDVHPRPILAALFSAPVSVRAYGKRGTTMTEWQPACCTFKIMKGIKSLISSRLLTKRQLNEYLDRALEEWCNRNKEFRLMSYHSPSIYVLMFDKSNHLSPGFPLPFGGIVLASDDFRNDLERPMPNTDGSPPPSDPYAS